MKKQYSKRGNSAPISQADILQLDFQRLNFGSVPKKYS